MSDLKVQIKNLYKIFGPDSKSMMEHVRNGVGKTELLERFSHVLGLNNINIDMPARKVQVIMGLSGSGKSTLIRHINRLIEPTEGEMIVDGQDVLGLNVTDLRNFRRTMASMVFQKFALMPHRTVADNVAYGLMIQGEASDAAHEHSHKWIDRVGLSGFENHYPAQLSGGMQQRVGLARALATDAEILLMDEAFSALDPLIRTDMQNVMLELQEELHKTIVFITHDLDEALRIGDNIAILRDGVMVQQGNPQQIVLSPADDYVSDFIKDINRGRVLQIGSVMSDNSTGHGLEIDRKVVVEDALPLLSQSEEKAATVTDDGSPIGSITLDKLIAAMARPASNDNSTNIYR